MESPPEFRIGPFSMGDVIALGGVLVATGALWAQVQVISKEQDRTAQRLMALEQVVPSEYVRRQDYREDVRELKQALSRIETKLDGKVDRP
jgi:ubiquinone biosynthesis protein UbiJ